MNDRLTKLQDWLQAQNIDAAFLTSPDTIFYCSGFASDPHERLLALILFQDREPFLVCPQMEVADAKNSGWTADIIGYTDIENPWEKITQAVAGRNLTLRKLAIEKEHMNVERYEQIQQYFSAPLLVSTEEKLRELRMIKTEDELVKLREACRLADVAVEIGVNEIAEGKTEMEILATIEYELKKMGYDMSFSTMVLTGKNAASPHGTPGLTKVQRGDLVLFDLGVVFEGYCSDITRTVAYGDVNEQQADIYETVRKAQEAAVRASRPGISCAELDLAARSIIQDKGYGNYFPHRLGHGLGISIHEYPSVTETNSLLLRPGMVYTIEPGIYVPNVAGVRIEDDIYITENGCEILTRYPKSIQIIK
jgi:Xaa-Pro dipeptidase